MNVGERERPVTAHLPRIHTEKDYPANQPKTRYQTSRKKAFCPVPRNNLPPPPNTTTSSTTAPAADNAAAAAAHTLSKQNQAGREEVVGYSLTSASGRTFRENASSSLSICTTSLTLMLSWTSGRGARLDRSSSST